MCFYILYKIVNLINQKYYIGIHKTNNVDDDYMGSGKRIKYAIKKYGKENFKKEILFYCNSYEELLEKEKDIITIDLLEDNNCYNIALGGKGSWYHVDHKAGRVAADIVLKEKYGPEFRTIISRLSAESNRNNKTGVFSENFVSIFKTNKEIQQMGTKKASLPEANEKRKKTLKEINHQCGEKNSQYGTCWIMNVTLKENKRIKKNDLEFWLQQGWIKGRKCHKEF